MCLPMQLFSKIGGEGGVCWLLIKTDQPNKHTKCSCKVSDIDITLFLFLTAAAHILNVSKKTEICFPLLVLNQGCLHRAERAHKQNHKTGSVVFFLVNSKNLCTQVLRDMLACAIHGEPETKESKRENKMVEKLVICCAIKIVSLQ